MDPITCCLLGICCPPFSEEQRELLEAQLTLHFDGDKEKAKKVCDEAFHDFAQATDHLAKAVKRYEKKEK